MSLRAIIESLLINDICRLHAATVTLTNDQIKALPSVPQTIIPAPGSGLRIGWYCIDVRSEHTSGAYTNVNADAYMYLGFNGSSPVEDSSNYLANDSGAAINRFTTFMGVTDRAFQFVPFQFAYETNQWGNLVQPNTINDNEGLDLVVNNGASGNFTGGHANNSWKLRALYRIEVS